MKINNNFDMQEQLENNKLIAEFDGWIIEKGMEAETDPYYNKGYGMILLSSMQYHKSWEWLMPVIEKIESIKDDYNGYFGVHIISNGCTIQATNFRPDKRIPEPPHYYNSFTLNSKIESTWYAVIEFLKWYKQKN